MGLLKVTIQDALDHFQKLYPEVDIDISLSRIDMPTMDGNTVKWEVLNVSATVKV